MKTSNTFNYLALGDSYTIGEAVNPESAYPMVATNIMKHLSGFNVSCEVIAKTGWRCDELHLAFKEWLNDSSRRKKIDFVSILIGVNNQYQGWKSKDFINDFQVIYADILEIVPKKSIAVISIPDYGFTPFGAEKKEEISLAIDDFNESLRNCCEKMEFNFYYVTDLTRRSSADLVAEDGLHLSEKCHKMIAERLASGFLFQMINKESL